MPFKKRKGLRNAFARLFRSRQISETDLYVMTSRSIRKITEEYPDYNTDILEVLAPLHIMQEMLEDETKHCK